LEFAMSAADKLRSLEVRAILPRSRMPTTDYMNVVADLMYALPEIIAVVERAYMHDMSPEMGRLLEALDTKLNA
jgi:hypothetical protein